jgi:hypothetical protein
MASRMCATISGGVSTIGPDSRNQAMCCRPRTNVANAAGFASNSVHPISSDRHSVTAQSPQLHDVRSIAS